MRTKFISSILYYRQLRETITLVVGDLGYSVIEPFVEQYPASFFNAGVAEQNMAGLAAGLASEGHTVFTYSIGNFPTFRCAEQIRNDIDYNALPVITTSIGAGVGYGSLGYSHHAIQDLALMRSFQNIVISSPCDTYDLEISMGYFCTANKPGYLRLPKSKPEIDLAPVTHSKHQGSKLILKRRDGRAQTAVIAIGSTLTKAEEIATKTGADLYTIPLWGEQNKKKIAVFFEEFDEIITVEDHLFTGGFASYMIESFYQFSSRIPKITTYCLDSGIIGSVGNEQYLMKKYLKRL